MKIRMIIGLLFGLSFSNVHAQTIDSIYFHLYTDSLKKEVHNYINVDGLLHNGRYLPLDTNHLQFSSSAGKWVGNNLILDKTYSCDSVVITVRLKQNPAMTKTVTVYMKKNLDNEALKTEEEILNDMRSNGKKRRKNG